MKKTLIIGTLFFIIASCSREGVSMEKKIIDMHTHAAGIGAGGSGCFISKELENNFRFNFYLKAFGITKKEVLKQGDAIIIQKLSEKLAQSQYVSHTVVLAMDGVINDRGELDREKTELYIPNSFVSQEVKKYNNLLFGASINPYRKDALQRLEEAHKNGAVLIKWLPPIQHIDPSDTRIIPFYKKMVELKIPLLTHAGEEKSFVRANEKFGDPSLLKLPLDLGVTVIIAHCAAKGESGHVDNMDIFLALLEKYPNLYGDISSLTQINRMGFLKKILAHPLAPSRAIYGTDMPLLETPIVSPLYHLFSLSPIDTVSLSFVKNPWDQDVMLKRKLGVPNDIFYRTQQLLGENNE